MYTWKECIFFCCGEMVRKCQLNPPGLVCHWRPLFSYWFSVWKVLSFMSMGCWGPLLWLFLFPLHVHQYLLYILGCSYIGCTNVYQCYILFLSIHFIMKYPYLSLTIVYFKVYIAWYEYCCPTFLLWLFPFAWNVFPSLSFWFLCVIQSEVGLL